MSKFTGEGEDEQERDHFNDYIDSLEYENNLVVFLDVLGWRSLIKRSETEKKLVRDLGLPFYSNYILKNLYKNESGTGFPCDIKISQFSDSIIISIKADKQYNFQACMELCLQVVLNQVVRHFLDIGVILRGGISHGLLINNELTVYGPALVRAYELEKDAVYPRIILDPDLATVMGLNHLVTGAPVKDNGKTKYMKTFRLDNKDEKIFFDFLQPQINMPGKHQDIDGIKKKILTLHDIIKRNLASGHDSRILSKYQWLASYHNSIVDEYKQHKLGVDKFLEVDLGDFN